MNKIACFLGAAMLLAGFSIPAMAAVENDLGRDWTIRGGFFFPERQGPRAAEGDIWFTIGAERTIYQAERWAGTFSIDYYGSGKVYNVPITMNVRGETNRLRYGVGAGVGISHDLSDGILGFSYNVLVGYTLVQGANPATFDVRYQGLSTGGGNLNGWQFTFGYKF